MMVQEILLLLLVGLAAPFSFRSSKINYNFGGAQLIPWDTRTVISDADFPCESEGPVRHPHKCNQFYMCLKIAQRSDIYNRYLYECSEGYVYSSTDQVCLTGKCLGDVIAESTLSGDSENTGSGSAGESGSDSSSGSNVESGGDSSAGSTGGSGSESSNGSTGESGGNSSAGSTGESGGGGSSGSSTSIENLPSVIDQSSSVIPAAEVQDQTEDCTKNIYVQTKEFCNLFRRCDDPNPNFLYPCVKGTAFKEEAQMCRIASFDESMCFEKKIFVPSKSLFREAFAWEEVGVLPALESSVSNANPFIFTNLATWQDSADPEQPKPLPFDTILRFAEFTQEEEKPRASFNIQDSLKKEDGEATTTLNVPEKKPFETGSKLDGKPIEKKPTENQSLSMENYELVAAIQYPVQIFNPYKFLGSSMMQPLSSVQQSSGSRYTIPIMMSNFRSPFSASTSSFSPLRTQAAPLSQLLKHGSLASSGFYSNPYVIPFGAYPYPSSETNFPYTSTRFFSGSYSPYASSPSAGLYQFPFSLSPFSSSPSNYFSSQIKNSVIPLSMPSVAADQSSSVNPYEMFQFKSSPGSSSPKSFDTNEQKNREEGTHADSFKEKTFYDPVEILSPKHTAFYDPSSTDIDSFLQSRNDDGEGYHVIPLSNEDVISLLEQSVRSQISPNYNNDYEN